jgi:excisionase family DNA binding protein
MLNENVFTIEEVSQSLRVPEDAVRKEIASGRLPAWDIGGYIRIPESGLASLQKRGTNVLTAVSEPETPSANSLELRLAADFIHTWPAKQGATKPIEQFTNAREGVVLFLGKEHHLKLGFTVRRSAGKRRRRSLVLVDRYPTVEFVAADEKPSGKMASIIRDRNGKQLPVGATIPPEYQALPVGPYSDVVVGPGASTGLAVICDAEDFDTMLKHAFIRYQFRRERA